TAAATSYSVHGLAMLPFYIYYSMFGFQRVGDAIWAAADQRSRGFLLGATSGRTTLGGEGLQHQDGSSHLVAATIPNCKAYDPAFAGELAVILDRGMRDMLIDEQDVFYYITLMNENYAQRDVAMATEDQIIRGCYLLDSLGSAAADTPAVTLLGSGAILMEVLQAAQQLADSGVHVDIVSVTSWSELARDGAQGEQGEQRYLQVAGEKTTPFVVRQLSQTRGPIIAASDYVRAVPESIRAYLPQNRRYLTLGTDGFGRSDTRQALREFFGVDASHIAAVAKQLLQESSSV
ncbi:MAG: pyruvate dehydrogenase (acetyl-transferring), homodimeric type, partial [Burkholderiales bacterium]|nr:pyruvate dehydrogenase (acetyl-transferring), homodimeric type [Burkholderiales bacterium]